MPVTSSRNQVTGFPIEMASADETDRGCRRSEREEATPRTPPVHVREPSPCAEPDEQRDECRPDERENPEHRSVRDAVGLLRTRFDESRAGERPARDDCGRDAGGDEQEPALHALAREQEPEQHHPDCDDRPRARDRQQQGQHGGIREETAEDPDRDLLTARRPEPESERERDVRNERERIPVVDWLAESRDADACRVECGNRLRKERPAEDDACDECERRRCEPGRRVPAHTGERDPQPEEDGEDDAPVERVPAAIGSDRPRERGAGPDDEQSGGDEKHSS